MVSASDVVSISLQLIREGGPDSVLEQLMHMKTGSVVIVNALSYRDLEVFVKRSIMLRCKEEDLYFGLQHHSSRLQVVYPINRYLIAQSLLAGGGQAGFNCLWFFCFYKYNATCCFACNGKYHRNRATG